MTVRPEVRKLAELGSFPLEQGAAAEQITMYETALRLIESPVSDEEARLLASLFPSEGSTFGLAWQLVHLIETAPSWPLAEVLDSDPTNEWIAHLRQSVDNSRRSGRKP
jgi:hypothetical protein